MASLVNLPDAACSRTRAPLPTPGSSPGSCAVGLPKRGRATIRRFAAPALLSILAACSAMPGQNMVRGQGDTAEVMMPPNEYIHPYAGKVTVMSLPHKAGFPLLSLSHHAAGQCAIWLPKVGDPGITQALYECLAVIEVANCNGATDINTPAVKARASFGERARYARTCSGRDWSQEFAAIGFEGRR